MLKDLVDHYATESEKNNQDYYVNIFRSDVKLKVYFGDKLGMDISSVDDMIAQYKAFGAAKASFHPNGQQVWISWTPPTLQAFVMPSLPLSMKKMARIS